MDSNNVEQLELDEEYSSFLDFQHLNIDLCLELIFPYLALIDLVNMADTCNQTRRAAELIFAQKYGRAALSIVTKNEITYYIANTPYLYEIRFCDPKICFKILRCFGHLMLILKLRIEYGYRPITGSWTHFGEYVSKYCGKNITKLEIESYDYSLEHFHKVSFPNLESISLIGSALFESLIKLNERFPKIRRLELAHSCAEIDDQSCIVEHFPHLEDLSIQISTRKFDLGFAEETVISMLKLNPNLRSLNLCSFSATLQEEFIRSISEICKSLDTLQITGVPLRRINGKIHFKSVKTFKIEQWYGASNSQIPLTFDALETFHWYSIRPFGSGFFNFVRNNPTISKLCLRLNVNFTITRDVANEIKLSCAFVKELEITYLNISTFTSAEKLTVFWDNCKSLQRFILNPINEGSYYQLLKLTESLQNVAVTIDKREESIICQKSQ